MPATSPNKAVAWYLENVPVLRPSVICDINLMHQYCPTEFVLLDHGGRK